MSQSLAANDNHRGFRIHVVCGHTAKTRDEGTRIVRSKQTQLSSENDDLTRKWACVLQVWRG
jgi:hypothetical protein